MLTNRQRLELAARLEAQLKTEPDPARREGLRQSIHNLHQMVKSRGLKDEEPAGEA